MNIAPVTAAIMLDELIKNCQTNLPAVNVELVKKAFNFAAIAHENDTRASNEPYFTHPYAVANILATEIPFDDVSICCALLHDIVEDNMEYSIDTIKKNFGEEIALIVDGLTKIQQLFQGADINQAENYRKLLMSVSKDIRVIVVKFADRLHNMRTIDFLNPEKRKRIAKETLEIYAPLAHRFGLGKLKWELEDLAFKELNKQAYEDIKKKVSAKRFEREKYIDKFSDPIVQKMNEYNINFEVSGRPKHLYSIYRKMIKRNKPFEEIYDLFAVRIILETEDINQCYTAFGIINQIFIPVPDRFKDYIAIPKTNNYQSIHTTVVGPDGELVEVQIRTRKMHDIAEKGVAAHWRYKEGNPSIDKTMNNYVSWIREMIESSGTEDVRKNILENFKLNLYSDEIYVFTPNGDLRRLPLKSTPVDFAFDIHTKIGFHCIGAKVNKKIIPLDTQLHSGDQVEIIISKNQHPNRNWLKFVVTNKAKAEVRKWLNKEDDDLAKTGKDLWEKKIKKMKLSFTPQDISKLYLNLKYENAKQFQKAIAQGKINLDELLSSPQQNKEEEKKSPQTNVEFENFAQYARSSGGTLVVDGESSNMLFSYSKCCNPIPGDQVVGFVTKGEGIKIHRKNCKSMLQLSEKESEKIISVEWPALENSSFIVGLSLKGEDQPGLLSEIAHQVVTFQNTNIKSINIDTKNSKFEGTVTLFVQNLEHLSRIIDRLKKIKGVYTVTRLENYVQ
ncbi:MAG: RelA/SpoT family protein [Ignavibacteria bacterium CG22_combo_CG10-13_8_21_14_all_37_15]|nr:bifunctional (p)ppGpp synthetase/guanosine-3',5'-bis(diphosphate) 3'-pyrophosphohydrolase [Ignavibacteria bacterium]OIO18328.1 MAG: RelA/SpoT family protein [Ignavibacteria bacterium CG1_02_37_35]PIP78260.1 MAG: RelA/SpoT family protein [Ignavibacteria bacterium CG22_combo_CG10-13_8_21_14_all_37_15]PIX94037.1 MAG: RelA/SpoT family protein [Ignavibacteria bacterium CG_4_10_14_3_um_filter_37_18]PJC57111.1 MAG: RelA/SpoT family protein [Ignavibacteria bacterium CG_4_9_14_0_2_um_filter_37_13]